MWQVASMVIKTYYLLIIKKKGYLWRVENLIVHSDEAEWDETVICSFLVT